MKQSRLYVAVASIAVAVAVILSNVTPVGAQNRAPEVQKIEVSTGADIGLDGLFIAALDKGYFKDEGLDVDWHMFPSGAAAAQTLATGQVPIGLMAETPAISLVANGVPVVMLASVSDLAEGEVMWVAADRNVKKPQDLYGLKIAYPSGSTGDLMINEIAKHYDLDLKKIQLVNLSPDDAVTAYAAKQIDGVVAWEPYLYEASQQRPTTLLHSGKTSYFQSNNGAKVTVAPAHAVCMMTADFVRKNPKATVAFMRAMARAQEYVSDPRNRAAFVSLSAKRLNQRDNLVEAQLKRYRLGLEINPTVASDLHVVGEFMKSRGRLKDDPPLANWLYSTPLKEVKPSLVTLNGTWQP